MMLLKVCLAGSKKFDVDRQKCEDILNEKNVDVPKRIMKDFSNAYTSLSISRVNQRDTRN